MSELNKPKVSVVMPAYNAETYLPEAIESIIEQTFKDFELIIVNDCSTDSTQKIIEEYAKKDSRIIVLSNEKNLKLSKSLNRGIEIAKGEYIARMDADDISISTRLEKQVSLMDENPDVGICGGAMAVIDEKGNRIGRRFYSQTDTDLKRKMFRYSPFSHPTIMIRKAVLDEVGLYNHAFNPAEDVELYFRIGKVAKFANLPDVVLRYRVLTGGMTGAGVRNMELKTLSARLQFFEDYHVGIGDKIYNLIQFASLWIMPPKFRVRLFNFLRTYIWK